MTRLWISWYRLRSWAVKGATAQLRKRQRAQDDRGDILQTVVITALLVSAAILVVGLLKDKAKDLVEGIQTQ
jgi:hypothetical protein